VKRRGGKRSGLDLYSTSPTKEDLCLSYPCINNAPFFAYKSENGVWIVKQGCCNSWTCPRCGIIRAKQEYWRIVNGITYLSEQGDIYFITITCRGAGMPLHESEEHYGEWTNKLLDCWRLACKRKGGKWTYVQVTERQKRGHPHSHILTTWKPHDLKDGTRRTRVVENGSAKMAYVPALRSEFVAETVVRSGLGREYDITLCSSAEGASRYVAKYLFKDTIYSQEWPKGWKRIRYSQSFPDNGYTGTEALALIKRDDWLALIRMSPVIRTADEASFNEALFWVRGHDVVVSPLRA